MPKSSFRGLLIIDGVFHERCYIWVSFAIVRLKFSGYPAAHLDAFNIQFTLQIGTNDEGVEAQNF
ncbi:hypothetical protein LL06_08740 [Hoeflea sp. BAL378]|nr:hypothetical protein LL06_08740 [Hoeflea sp. BAL378]